MKSCCEFSTSWEAITSNQHLDGDIPGDVRVIVSESADQREAAATLLRIAAWTEAEIQTAESPRGDGDVPF